MSTDLNLTGLIDEAKRQVEICNACRYCEGYCSVFPAIQRNRAFVEADIEQFAQLCHNCRGCYYACQYTSPHGFDMNLPNALANVRQVAWKDYAYPKGLANFFSRSGGLTLLLTTLAFALFFAVAKLLGQQSGTGFYAWISHSMLVAIFMPAFILPLIFMAISLRRYWRAVGGGWIMPRHIADAGKSAATMRNLSGGHGEGCNFEDADAFSLKRKWYHHATMYGFLLCFASTSSATVLHYVFDMPAPYGLFSIPKLFGISGGILLCIGTLGLSVLKSKSDPELAADNSKKSDAAFIMLLFFVSASGLLLYALGKTSIMPLILALHLGAVLTFFITMPYNKMVHGFYRLMALIQDEVQKETK